MRLVVAGPAEQLGRHARNGVRGLSVDAPQHRPAAQHVADGGVGVAGGQAEARPAQQPGQVDLWEVNEAFAAVTMAAMSEFKLAHEIVNVHGGACALGHPIGASGARIIVTLLGALKKRGQKKGVAALCIGGGEATAVAVELC